MPRSLSNRWMLASSVAQDRLRELQDATAKAMRLDVGYEQDAADPGYEVRDGVAIINYVGTSVRYYDWIWCEVCGCVSTDETRRVLRDAASDSNVSSIVLRIDSPGGEAAGADALASDIAAIAATKPIVAFVDGQADSGGYYTACRGTKIVATRESFIGSIGAYCLVLDWSKAFADAGIKPNLITSASPLKGAGALGTEVQPEQVAQWQSEIDAVANLFVSAVAAGRGLSTDEAKALATGASWIAAEALTRNLIDEVGTLERAVELARSLAVERSADTPLEDLPMANPNPAPSEPMNVPSDAAKAASLAEIKAACPGASAEFIVAALDKSYTVEQCRSEYVIACKAEADKAKADAEKALADAKAARAEADAAKAKAAVADPTANIVAEPIAASDASEDESRWISNPILQSEFNGNKAAYLAFANASRAGRVAGVINK